MRVYDYYAEKDKKLCYIKVSWDKLTTSKEFDRFTHWIDMRQNDSMTYVKTWEGVWCA